MHLNSRKIYINSCKLLVFRFLCLEINERNDVYLKKKLNDALLKKHREIEQLSEKEEYEKRCGKKKTTANNEHCCQQLLRKNSNSSHHKKNKKSFEEEWDVHRAYQLLLSEHHKRVKTSDMNKDAAPKHPKKSNCGINCGCQLKEMLL